MGRIGTLRLPPQGQPEVKQEAAVCLVLHAHTVASVHKTSLALHVTGARPYAQAGLVFQGHNQKFGSENEKVVILL